ncbi:3'-5' exonuclease-like isoform X4 [Musa acuminata AAA Group]|uniref:3'-5' exonuclease-like isoform X4 n=1 Tax=Musa acuminata AAA Group TaxID=214697 RepID=UPI0031E2DA2C
MEKDGDSFLDWDWDLVAEEELRAIEGVYYSSAKKRRISSDLDADDPAPLHSRPSGRRLPDWGRADATESQCHGGHGGGVATAIADRPPSSCPTNGAWRVSPLRCPGNFKVRYPTMAYRGSIIYCRTAPEVEQASMELLNKIRSMKQCEAPRKAAVMQICLENARCYVMHIIHSGIPPGLKCLLEDTVSVKVGVCIANDAWKMTNDYNVCVEPLEDLSSLANLKLGGVPKRWSLASLTEMITCKQLEKPKKIRMGNWEADVLSKEQLQYAATDAFVSWHLYQQILKGFPDAKYETKNVEKVKKN